jgi:hypothetical protein
MTINFNVDPYFDDYDEDDKYLRVLFRPGYPVQARELTQAQTILQNQVARFGNHVFKQGSMVTPGQVSYDGYYAYVKLQTIYNNTEVTSYVAQFVGQTIIGTNSGVKALVLFTTAATETDPPTLYVKYQNSGTNTTTKVFADNEQIVSQDNTNQRFAFTYTQDATGFGSSASIQKGIYFVNGFFTQVDTQIVILDKYTNTPTYRIGLDVSEDIVTPEEDNNLFDNAEGSTNFAAPGAHRYKITLTLEKRPTEDDGDIDFIELLRVNNGEVQYQVKNAAYADIMETMARRTFDESGNYSVKPFGIDVREHRNNDRGTWDAGVAYKIGDIVANGLGQFYVARTSGISTTNKPVHTLGVSYDGTSLYWEYSASPPYNRGVYSVTDGGDEAYLAMGIEKGKAYVQGFEIEKLATTYVKVPKSRDYKQILDGKISTPVGNFVEITNLYGPPNLPTFPIVELRDTKTVTRGTAAGNLVGNARIRGIELESGTNGSVAAYYKAMLFDIDMHSGITTVEITSAGANYGVLTTVVITGTAGQFTCAAASLAVGQSITISGTYGGTGSITGYTNPKTYYIISITGSGSSVTGFTLSATLGGTAITTTAGTPTGLTYTPDTTITIADPFINGVGGNTVSTWGSGGTVAVGQYVAYTNSGVKNFYKVISGTTLGSSAPTHTYGPVSGTVNGSAYIFYSGTTATATAVISAGAVVAVQVTRPGNGYVTAPTFTFASGTAAVASAVGKLDFSRLVKQLAYASDAAGNAFTADAYPVYTTGLGTITATGAGTSALCTGNGTLFLRQVKVGDILRTSDGREFKVGFVIDNATLYASTNISAGFSDRAFSILNNPMFEPTNLALLYRLPYETIRRIRSVDDATIGTTTRVREYFTEQTVNSSYQLNYSTDTADQTFLTPNSPYSTDVNYLLVKTSGGNLSTYPAGTVIAPTNIQFTDTTQRNIQITVPSGLYDVTGSKVRLIATVNKSQAAAGEKTKALQYDGIVNVTVQASVQANSISLGKPDVYRIQKILQSKVTFGTAYDPAVVTDITDNYVLDNGQRDTHYDIASITKKPGVSAPNGPIRIYFEYFTHSGTGDYFSVDSYSGLNYKDIPSYKGTSLSNYIDFRARINDDGKAFTSAPMLPKRSEDLLADYTYYLARRGSLVLNGDGSAVSKEGVPSDAPDYPEAPGTGMVLYNITYMPYTYNTTNKQVIISSIDNRRYTMRDIGKLESRIEKLEEFTKLSLLERATASTQVTDTASLNDRLKAGFIVDTFDGHTVGGTTELDYRVSIDTINREARPLYNIENVNLIEKNFTDNQRATNNYIVNGDVFTLPFSHKVMISQLKASRTENINPFAIFTFIGNLTLNPASDEWVDVENIDVTVFDEKEKQSLESLAAQTFNPVTGKKGILGNYYNAWQEVATGRTKTISGDQRTVSDFTRPHASVGGPNSGWFRRVHDEIDAKEIGYQRTQYTTEVKLIGSSTPILTEDKVTSSTVIPYIRSRPLLFVGKGIKPTTTVNAFFDGTSVNEYVVPAKKIVITNRTGTFDDKSNVGANNAETTRLSNVDGKTVLAYNKGDVVYVATRGGSSYTADNAPATAIVALVEDSTTALRLVNVIGTFAVNDIIVGSVSGARATVSSIETPTTLITNENGEVAGVFTIPNMDKLRFRCGSRIFRLSDTATDLNSTTRAEAAYLASGVKEKHNRTFSSIRHYEIATRELPGQTDGAPPSTWVNDPASARTIGDTNWYDPLAQTFLVQNPGGMMLSKINIYFQSKDTSVPVRMEIRETVNGYPGKVILPFSQVTLNPSQVNISDTATVATTFTFPVPIPLRDKTEYAVVLLSDSNNYKVWIAQMGEKDVITGRPISEQPYMGVMFKSQNGSTWTAEQYQDLKFELYRAKFDTGVVATIDFVNDIMPTDTLKSNPFETTYGSGEILVTHYNHGMPTGSKVKFTVPSGTYHGISSTLFNTSNTVTRISHNKYKITLGSNANATGLTGGDNIIATRNVQFNLLHPQVEEFILPDTNIQYYVQAATGKSLDGTEVPYVLEDVFVEVTPNQSNYFSNPRMLVSSLNELTQMNGSKSFTLRAKMYTTNDAVSPMLDIHRTSALVVENMINNQDTTNITYVDELTPKIGSSLSKYITKKVKLTTPGTGLYTSFDLNCPPEASVNVYYKAAKSADAILFELQSWKLSVPDALIIPKSQDETSYQQVIFTEEKLDEFDTVQVKVVFTSTNSSAVPKIQNLKVIALA